MTVLLNYARDVLKLVRRFGSGFLEPEDEIGLAILGMSELVLYKVLPEGKPLRAEQVLELDTWSLRMVMANDILLARRARILPSLEVTPKEELHFAWSKYVAWVRTTLYPATEAFVRAESANDVCKRHAIIGFLWMYFVARGSLVPDLDQALRSWLEIFDAQYPSDGSIPDDAALDALLWVWERNAKRTDLLFVSRDHRLKFGKRQLKDAFERVAGRGSRKPAGPLEVLEDHLQGSEGLTLLDTVADPKAVDGVHLLALRELQELRERPELPRLLRPALDALTASSREDLLHTVAWIRQLADLLREIREPALQAAILCEGLGVDGRGGQSPSRSEVAEHYGVSERQLGYRVKEAHSLLLNLSA